ncbi:MAG: acylneuraminate cytidylyltransferase [Chloroflexi bacterium]|nr:MAG: acylneuraminate cytidylyltransferase [Chloroflexota bacterium]
MEAHIVAIIQARTSSSRLPGKVLQDIAGQPMLVRVVERVRRAKKVASVVVATTVDPSDDGIEALCAGRGYACFRGSLYDVLDRYYQASRRFEAGVIVRITADCPVIDPAVIDLTVSAYLGELPAGGPSSLDPYDFAANRLPPPWKRTYPIGLDTEVCSFAALERAWKEAGETHQREHVMPYLYEKSTVVEWPSGRILEATPPEKGGRGFRVLLVNHERDYGSLRWTVDTPADLDLIRQVYLRFEGHDDFSWTDLLALFEREPALAQINAHIHHKTVHDVDERTQS